MGSFQFEVTMNSIAKTHPVIIKTSTDSLFSKLCIYLASRSRFFDLKIKNFNQSFNLATPILIRVLGKPREHEPGCKGGSGWGAENSIIKEKKILPLAKWESFARQDPKTIEHLNLLGTFCLLNSCSSLTPSFTQ